VELSLEIASPLTKKARLAGKGMDLGNWWKPFRTPGKSGFLKWRDLLIPVSFAESRLADINALHRQEVFDLNNLKIPAVNMSQSCSQRILRAVVCIPTL